MCVFHCYWRDRIVTAYFEEFITFKLNTTADWTKLITQKHSNHSFSSDCSNYSFKSHDWVIWVIWTQWVTDWFEQITSKHSNHSIRLLKLCYQHTWLSDLSNLDWLSDLHERIELIDWTELNWIDYSKTLKSLNQFTLVKLFFHITCMIEWFE